MIASLIVHCLTEFIKILKVFLLKYLCGNGNEMHCGGFMVILLVYKLNQNFLILPRLSSD